MHRALACALTITWIFRKNAEHLMCNLTTGWDFSKCTEPPSVCTYHITWILATFYGDALYGEGSNASSTNEESGPITELWGAENSFLRMRGNSDAQKGAACS